MFGVGVVATDWLSTHRPFIEGKVIESVTKSALCGSVCRMGSVIGDTVMDMTVSTITRPIGQTLLQSTDFVIGSVALPSMNERTVESQSTTTVPSPNISMMVLKIQHF